MKTVGMDRTGVQRHPIEELRSCEWAGGHVLASFFFSCFLFAEPLGERDTTTHVNGEEKKNIVSAATNDQHQPNTTLEQILQPHNHTDTSFFFFPWQSKYQNKTKTICSTDTQPHAPVHIVGWPHSLSTSLSPLTSAPVIILKKPKLSLSLGLSPSLSLPCLSYCIDPPIHQSYYTLSPVLINPPKKWSVVLLPVWRTTPVSRWRWRWS